VPAFAEVDKSLTSQVALLDSDGSTTTPPRRRKASVWRGAVRTELALDHHREFDMVRDTDPADVGGAIRSTKFSRLRLHRTATRAGRVEIIAAGHARHTRVRHDRRGDVDMRGGPLGDRQELPTLARALRRSSRASRSRKASVTMRVHRLNGGVRDLLRESMGLRILDVRLIP